MFNDIEAKDAAQILRGLKKRVDDLEQAREAEGFVNFLRIVVAAAIASDSATTTIDDSPGAVYDSNDRYDFSEYQ